MSKKATRPAGVGQKPAAGPLDRLEAGRAGRSKLILAGIVVVSVLLRVGYFIQLNAGPCIWQHRWDQCDMNFFDRWARQIAAGDWLCENVSPPIHAWHRRMAADYYRRHPDEFAKARRAEAAGGPSPARALWNRWAGGRRFYQGPLYPYLIALTYKIWPDVRAVFIWQMIAGVLVNVLVYLVARRLFGNVTAVLAALMACLYAPLLQTELVLVRMTLVVLAALAMVYLADVARRRGSFASWLIAGLVMGLSLVLKAHFALFVAGAAVILVVHYFRRRGVLIRSAVGLAAGVAIGVAPLVARNVAVGIGPFETASSARPAFALWNGYQPGAGVEWRPEVAARIMGQVGGHGSVIRATLATHPGIGSVVRLVGARFPKALGWYELPDNANFYYYRLHSSVLRLMPLTFFALAPLAIVGMALALPRAGRSAFLYLQVFTNLVVLVCLFPVGRFRLPMAAAMIPFAALTIVCLARWLTLRRFAQVSAVALAVVLVGFWTGRPLGDDRHEIRPADYKVPYDVYYQPLIAKAVKAGAWRRAADITGRLVRYRPEWLDAIGPARRPRGYDEMSLVRWYAQLYGFYAQTCRRAGRAGLAGLAGLAGQSRLYYRRSRELTEALKSAVDVDASVATRPDPW